MIGIFETWESWMGEISCESRGARSSLDTATGYQTITVEFRHPSDPGCVLGFLGEQVRPNVYRPTRVLLDNYLADMGDEILEPDPETFEISNLCEIEEGLGEVCVGYSFLLRFQWQDRYETEMF